MAENPNIQGPIYCQLVTAINARIAITDIYMINSINVC